MFSIDKESVPYSWNHTITYDPSRGKMPFLVQMLHATAISTLYHPLEEVLEYRIQASISKGERTGVDKADGKEYIINITEVFVFLLFFGTFVIQMRCNVAGERSNQCPQGFTLVSAGPYCAGKAQ